jgi:hypothetical protein
MLFGPKRGKVTGGGENCVMRSFIACMYSSASIIGMIKEDEMGRECSTNGGREMHVRFLWKSRKERDHSEDIDVDRRII